MKADKAMCERPDTVLSLSSVNGSLDAHRQRMKRFAGPQRLISPRDPTIGRCNLRATQSINMISNAFAVMVARSSCRGDGSLPFSSGH